MLVLRNVAQKPMLQAYLLIRCTYNKSESSWFVGSMQLEPHSMSASSAH